MYKRPAPKLLKTFSNVGLEETSNIKLAPNTPDKREKRRLLDRDLETKSDQACDNDIQEFFVGPEHSNLIKGHLSPEQSEEDEPQIDQEKLEKAELLSEITEE